MKSYLYALIIVATAPAYCAAPAGTRPQQPALTLQQLQKIVSEADQITQTTELLGCLLLELNRALQELQQTNEVEDPELNALIACDEARRKEYAKLCTSQEAFLTTASSLLKKS